MAKKTDKKGKTMKAKEAEKKKANGGFYSLIKRPKDEIAVIIKPLAIRNNCGGGMGSWTIGTVPLEGDLNIAILAVNKFYGKLGKGAACFWLEVFFVKAPGCPVAIPENVVCVTYIKTQSLTSFVNQIILKGEESAVDIWEATFIPKSNAISNYFAIEFECRERKEHEMLQLEAIQRFMDKGEILVNNDLPETMIAYDTEEEAAEAVAAVNEMLKEQARKIAEG